MSRPAGRFWIFVFASWTILGLLSGAQRAAWLTSIGRPVDVTHTLLSSLGDWLTCGILTPGVLWVVRRFPLRGGDLWGRIPIHVAAALVFAVVKSLVWTPVFNALNPTSPESLSQTLMGGMYGYLLTYAAAAAVLHAIAYHSEWRERQLETARLALENLRAQLQPHFLFNTLQSISTLIHRDPPAADRMLTQLSELLRLSLRNTGGAEVTLAEELEFLDHYLAIMRVRFGDRLAIEIEADDGVREALVPAMLLQPIVENAIEHGMRDRADIGHVLVRAEADGGALLLSVWDDGPGMNGGAIAGAGIGLSNARERITRLYGGEGRLEVTSPEGRGFTVRIEVPLRRG